MALNNVRTDATRMSSGRHESKSARSNRVGPLSSGHLSGLLDRADPTGALVITGSRQPKIQ
jgi:hypothetical protein